MPEMRSYKIVQIREVEVSANTTEGAIRIASAAFEFGQRGTSVTQGKGPEGVWGNTTSQVKETSLLCERTS